MVGIAQLAERLVVVQEVAGSSPVTHPNGNDEGPEMSLRAFVMRKKKLLVLVFGLERIARCLVERVGDVKLAGKVARFNSAVSENRLDAINERNNAQLLVVGAVNEHAFFGVTRKRSVDELGGEKDVSVVRCCHVLRLPV